jgi:hypothetical protein
MNIVRCFAKSAQICDLQPVVCGSYDGEREIERQ